MKLKIPFNLLLIRFLILVVLIPGGVHAQKSIKYDQKEELFRKAMDLFEKEKFGSAQRVFEQVREQQQDIHSELASNASYYRALCGLQLFNTNAENLLIEFMTEYPESPKVNRARFDLGQYQYRKRKFAKAIGWFEQVDVYNLTNEEIAEYYFKLGYSYFQEDRKKEALKSLFEIKDAETKYSIVAKYYYAHLSYETGNLETSLTYFREIEHQPSFSSVIPYYISQILYKQAKYDEVISYASSILDSARAQRAAEISRLIGESYFRTNRFKEALPYLTAYVNATPNALPEEYYEVAYTYERVDQNEEAVKWYQKALSDDDSINQIVQYNMGEVYLKMGQKMMARNSMGEAYRLGSDEKLKESALYNYAKLAYELSQFPFNDAIRSFEKYLNEYPNSPNFAEANEYLVSVYFTTKNYEEARKSLERIENRSLKLNIAYQKILYYLGVEKMNRGEYEQAIEFFDIAIKEDYVRSVKIDAEFWKAEAYFRLLSYDLSVEAYEKFLFEPGAISSAYYTLAQYNLGYAHYRKKDYKSAIYRFRQFVSGKDTSNLKLTNDALLRVADSYFITRDYKNAAAYYDKAAAIGVFEKDYALFQSALANGVMGDYAQKISKLEILTTSFKNSIYYDDALYELGDILLIKGKHEKALALFEELIKENPESPYYGKSMLKTGLIYFNDQKDTLALERFKIVVTNYRNTSESREAMDKIKQIYIARGDLNAFEAYMSSIGFDDIPATSLDSAAYEIAENAYLENNCADAVKNFSVYMERYSQGLFLLNAHYYRGDCELRAGYKEEALLDFEYVVSRPKSIFTEKALLSAAVICREMNNTDKAITYYSDLEKKADLASNRDKAEYWLMRMYFDKEEYGLAHTYASTILAKQNLSEDIRNEILILSGDAFLKEDNYNKAYDSYYALMSSNDEHGAKAKFNLAYIEYMRSNLDSSEKFIDALLNQVPSYDYWIARAFILWSEIYMVREDIYQAKVSLQSVVDNYEGEDLKGIAQEKLDLIEKLEKEKKDELLKAQKKVEVNFEGMEDYDYLFEEEEIDE